MRVLVLGSGAREHALCSHVAASPRCEALFCAPGNPGISQHARLVPIDPNDGEGVAAFCQREDIDLVLVGPEGPLVAGVADRLRRDGVRVLGPGADGARLEGSKSWAKAFMARHGIPTADARVFTDGAELLQWLGTCPLPVVVKADGLAAGKGVSVCYDRADALAAGQAIGVDRRFGEAGATVLVEEFMVGEEVTVLVLLDGVTVLPLLPTQDHKRRFDGDQGPNTGGMGAFGPVPAVDEGLMQRILKEILLPTARGLRGEGIDFRGVLYAGLMLTADGPRVVEFNVRFGDPECQVLCAAARSDLLPVLDAAARGALSEVAAPRWAPGSTCCVVVVERHYPDRPRRPVVVLGLPTPGEHEALFHAATTRDPGGALLAMGGRVFSAVAWAPCLSEASDRATALARRVQFFGADLRSDIGRGGANG